MRSFRSRLLLLIIGLVVVTEAVTLVAVLASTERDVKAQAAERLRTDAVIADQFIRFRASQLSAAAAVLVADFGFRESVASGDAITILSAAQNHAARIGADVVMVSDLRGRVIASSVPGVTRLPESLESRLSEEGDSTQDPCFAVLEGKLYQFVRAPVRAPEAIGWAVMGFVVNDALATKLRELLRAQVTIVAAGAASSGSVFASTLSPEQRAPIDPMADADPGRGGGLRTSPLASPSFLGVTRALDEQGTVRLVLQTLLGEVLEIYDRQRTGLLLISALALMLAIGIGVVLGRSTTRPIGQLVRAAERVRSGTYDTTVQVSGAEEFKSLAETFNAMQRDIAAREARILHDAYHDSLTGLANADGAERRLSELLVSSASVAVYLIDVGNLRDISASFGQHLANEALHEVVRRLRQNTASSDVVARVGPSQFLIVSPGCTAERAPLAADQLCAVISTACHLPSISLELRATSGVACYPAHGGSAAELLQRARIALDDAEEQRLRTGAYQAGRAEEHQRRLALVSGLKHAMGSPDQLSLVYQPKLDIQTRSVRSVEALVRWAHPDLGSISPAEFVPLAERAGSARALSSWVLREAIRQMAAWSREFVSIDTAVNLSAPDILDPLLADEILRELDAHGVDPRRLLLEITESAVMRDAHLAARHMQLLRAQGVRFAIDDFGTGYSSLSQLARLPVDELKIDRSFVQRIHDRRGDVAIVRATIELAHTMGLKVVAEGVETAEGWTLLRQLGCDYAQGFFISKPLPSQGIAQFVRRTNELLPASDSTVRQIRALGELRAGQKG